LATRSNDASKILLWDWVVKGKIAFSNSPVFPAKIDDFGLECGIPRENLKNNSTGRKIASGTSKIFPNRPGSVRDFLDSCPKHRKVHLVIDENQTPCPATPKGNPLPLPTDFRR
jgi:hypothetical protein